MSMKRTLFCGQPHGGKDGGKDGDAAADDIRQHREVKINRRREQRADDARQRAGALGHADGGPPVSYTHLTLPTIYSV